MKRTRTLWLLFVLVAVTACFVWAQQSAETSEKSVGQFVREVDARVPKLLQDFAVPGAAMAIINDGEVVLQKGYGLADVESGTEVTTKTGFNIGSISKTIAAWGVMKLVEEGKIDLDAPAEKYLTRWHLPESEFDSSEVTIRRLLSHTAGLSLHGYPGWSPDDELPTVEESLNGTNNGPGRVEIIMQPGKQYKYSGGGYTVLQLIIEEVTGQKFEDYMQAEILDPLGMTNSSYKIDDRIMAASAAEYDSFGEETDFELFTAQAAAGFHTTIEDFARFALANLYGHDDFEQRNSVLTGDTIRQMMKPVPQARGRYGYGMGYFAESLPGTLIALAGHRGANTGWHAIFTVNPETNDGFIMVTNGGSGQRVYGALLYDWTRWATGVTLEDWHNAKPSIANKLKTIIDARGTDDIATVYAELKENQPEGFDFAEDQLNELGYYYMATDDLEKALAIFKLNIEAFPDAANPYDSYGEALLKSGAREEAIANYRKSVELDPSNANGVRVLNELGVPTDFDPYFQESLALFSESGPEVITRNILQDGDGDFWLATWSGIIGYDGATFRNVTNQEGLRRYRAFCLLEDHQHNIWVGTVGAGVYRYAPTTGGEEAWTNFTTKDGLVDDAVVSLMQDRDNNIWIGAMGVTKYDGTDFTSFNEEDGFTSSDVNSISQAPDGSMWFGTRGALFHYDGDEFVNFTEEHGLQIPGYIPTLFDRNGHLWFGGENGIYHYDGQSLRHLFRSASYSMMEDSHGNIWFSGGVLKDAEPKSGVSVLNRFDPEAGLEAIKDGSQQFAIEGGRGIFGLAEDKDGHIWFTTGRGIGRIDDDGVRYY